MSQYLHSRPNVSVAPLAGAWIEIPFHDFDCFVKQVAPLAGAWIEILYIILPSDFFAVAPLAGAWIEILLYAAGWFET